MKIVIAPDKFKGCSPRAAACARRSPRESSRSMRSDRDRLVPHGRRRRRNRRALVAATGGRFITRRVTGPLPEMKVDATFGMLGDGQTAVIEMAAASGLALLQPEDRNPLNTTTFGTGELLMAAAGTGRDADHPRHRRQRHRRRRHRLRQACGFPVLLEDGEPVSPTEPLCGRDLDRVLLIKHGRGSSLDGVDHRRLRRHQSALRPQRRGSHLRPAKRRDA